MAKQKKRRSAVRDSTKTGEVPPPANPFKLLNTSEKAALRPYLAVGLRKSLGRPLNAAERALAARIDEDPIHSVGAALIVEAITADPAAATALEKEDPELFAAIGTEVQPRAELARFRTRRGPRPHIEPDFFAAAAPGIAATLTGGLPLLDISGSFEDLEDFAEAAKDIGEGAKGVSDFFKELNRIYKEWKRRNQGQGTVSVPPPGGPLGAGTEEEQVPFILPDEFGDLYGETLEKEDGCTVWLDRVCALEVDGAGDDNVYWVAQALAYLKEPRRVVVSAGVSQEYDLDELQEARLSPLADFRPGRIRLVDVDEWKVRQRIRDRDAILAVRRGAQICWFPLSKLERIDLWVDLYESDHSALAEEALAAIITAVLAALAFFKGKVTPSIGATAALTQANQDALSKLFKLIAGDTLLLEGRFTITPAQIRDAFATATRFPVREHDSEAAAGHPSQRAAQAYGEDGTVYDTTSIDEFNSRRPDELNDPDYYEEEFDSYYEIRLRYERREPGAGQ